MSKEQAIRDALADVSDLISQGFGWAEAIAQCASENGVKSDVLLARAERQWGMLHKVEERAHSDRHLIAIAHRYLATVPAPATTIEAWYASVTGRGLSDAEIQQLRSFIAQKKELREANQWRSYKEAARKLRAQD